MSARVILYSKANCSQCFTTELALRKAGVMYGVKKIDEDPDALAFVKSLGYNAAPVVWVEDESGAHHWSHYRKDKLDQLATQVREAQSD